MRKFTFYLFIALALTACRKNKSNGSNGITPIVQPKCPISTDTLINGQCVAKPGWYKADSMNFPDWSKGKLWKGLIDNGVLKRPYLYISETNYPRQLEIVYMGLYSDDGGADITNTGTGDWQNLWPDIVKGDSVTFRMPPLKQYSGWYLVRFHGRFNQAKDSMTGMLHYEYGGSRYQPRDLYGPVHFIKIRL